MFEKMLDWNTENPMVRDGLWDNSERYDDPDEPELPYGYHELNWRIYTDNLTPEQKDAFTATLKACARNCTYDVTVKRFDDYINVEGVVNYDEEDMFGEICDPYEDYGMTGEYL